MTDGGTVTHNGIDINTAEDNFMEVVQSPIQGWLHCWLTAGIPFPHFTLAGHWLGRGQGDP